MTESNEPIHIAASLWGTAYNEKDANNLYSMICRNTSREVCFHLFSGNKIDRLYPHGGKFFPKISAEMAILIYPEKQIRKTTCLTNHYALESAA